MTDPTPVTLAAPLVSQRHHSTFSWVMWWCWWSFLLMCTVFFALPWMIASYRRRTAKTITRSM